VVRARDRRRSRCRRRLICTGPQSHPAREHRYVAGVVCGVAYVVVGLFAASLVGLLRAVPEALVATVAGVALLGALIGALRRMFVTGDTATPTPARATEAAVIAFAVTASGITWGRIGSAFWGLVAVTAVWLVLGTSRRVRQSAAPSAESSADV
jgi:benzoate membrane transport protein